MTIKGWVDGFITKAMQTFCQIRLTHVVRIPPALLLLANQLRRIQSNQTQGSMTARASKENFLFKRRTVPRTNNFPKIIFKSLFNLPKSLAY